MNQPIDTTLMIIIILLLILIIVLIVIAAIFLLNYLKGNNLQNKSAMLDTKDIAQQMTPGTGTCRNHENKNSVGICAICEEEFCVDCLKQIDKVNLCPEHFNTFADNIWHPITNQRTTPDDPKDGVYIYQFKNHLWKDKGIPSYIVNEYKIEVESDHIETYVQLYVKEANKEELKNEIEQYKGCTKNEK